MLAGEMASYSPGAVSWDPALAHAWNELWGSDDVARSPEDVALLAAEFIKQEGDWGHGDDAPTRVYEEITAAKNTRESPIWNEWYAVLSESLEGAD